MLHSRPYVQLNSSGCFSPNIHIYLFSQFPMFAHIFNISRFHCRYNEYKSFSSCLGGTELQPSQRHLLISMRLLSLERRSCPCSVETILIVVQFLSVHSNPKKKKKKKHSFEFQVYSFQVFVRIIFHDIIGFPPPLCSSSIAAVGKVRFERAPRRRAAEESRSFCLWFPQISERNR